MIKQLAVAVCRDSYLLSGIVVDKISRFAIVFNCKASDIAVIKIKNFISSSGDLRISVSYTYYITVIAEQTVLVFDLILDSAVDLL